MASPPSNLKPSKRPRRAVQDILDNIASIRTYTAGMDRVAFEADRRTVDAVERCLGRLTEAARRLGSTAEALAPGIPWREICGLGDILRHDYDTVSLDTIWQTVTSDFDALEAACRQALATLPPDPPSKRRAR
jgi:uncharacterized protein with HEPN domain